MKRLIIALFLAGVPFAPANAASQSIQISATVPVICHGDFVAQPAPLAAVVPLGTITEFCNDGSGYRISADYTAVGDPGTLYVDGMPVPLSPSGHSVIAEMNGPRAITQSLSYRPGSTPIAAISIRLQAASL
jgi:hypothetical protein